MNIKQLRAALARTPNLSQLARDSGVSLPTVRRIKNGRTPDPRVGTVERLERQLKKDQHA